MVAVSEWGMEMVEIEAWFLSPPKYPQGAGPSATWLLQGQASQTLPKNPGAGHLSTSNSGMCQTLIPQTTCFPATGRSTQGPRPAKKRNTGGLKVPKWSVTEEGDRLAEDQEREDGRGPQEE